MLLNTSQTWLRAAVAAGSKNCNQRALTLFLLLHHHHRHYFIIFATLFDEALMKWQQNVHEIKLMK
jgi:hypothetical protein